ncbi:serine/threonine-protein kinase Nek10 isoform 2-T2 [Spinachia spinachia]
MFKPVKKVTQGEKLPMKSKEIQNKGSHDLRRLLCLLAMKVPGQELRPIKANSIGAGGSQSPHPPKDTNSQRRENDVACEASELEKFSITYRDQRCFSELPMHKLFSDILRSLVKNRLCSEWIDNAGPEFVLKVLMCLRLLIRDPHHQKILHQLQGVRSLARYMERVAAGCAARGEHAFAVQKLVSLTYTFQKLSAVEDQRAWVIESGAHVTLVKLLSTTHSSVLLGALLALTTLAESPQCKQEIGQLPVVERLLVILQEYDLLSKRMSAELLRLLSPVRQVREQVSELEGLPVLLSLLHGQDPKLLWSAAWVLVQLCEDPDARREIRSWGAVQQLLRLLSREHIREELSPQEEVDNTGALQSACCTILTELCLDDTSAHYIVQENGVYIVSKLVLPQNCGPKVTPLQCCAFRTLRFLFSVERNRHLFKRLFPADLFELFIDIGHYVRDLAAYDGLQTKVSFYTVIQSASVYSAGQLVFSYEIRKYIPLLFYRGWSSVCFVLQEEELDSLRESIEAVDRNRPPLKVINGYSILDHLGTGAFGSVFKVRKQIGQNLLALKEVNLRNPVFGKDKKSRDSNVEKIISELTIAKEQMTHPNIVKYYKTFLEGDRLYIVMELIEGVPLAEHLNSLNEKHQKLTEDRLWNIFIQMCLGLRYLHKEKRIVHRDLTPNNVMLGEKDKVTITDFGLAKQKQENSKLTSVVGTILYSCPEVVKNEPYGEKADVWALGCILYQMAALQPPFNSSNMLSLATKIVEAVYEPVEEGAFSDRVKDMIGWCLCPDADQRPDIVEVSSRISDLMMGLMDGLYASHNALERRAERDRKRAQKYFLERHKSRTQCWNSNSSQEKSLINTESPTPRSPATWSSNHRWQNISQDDASDGDGEPRDANGNATDTDLVQSGDCAAAKIRPKPGICVSQKKVRQIDDPAQRLLLQLHKIVYITQLPPAPHHNLKRRVVERFKKYLFHFGSDPYNLRMELSKLLHSSPELMEFSTSSSDWWLQVHHFEADSHAADGPGGGSLKDGVTYQQMQGIIEELLEESSYYEGTHCRISEKRNDQGDK